MLKIRKVPNRNLYTTQVRMPNGKYKSVYGRTKKLTKEKALALIHDIETGNYVPRKGDTFKKWADNNLENNTINLKDTTIRTKKEYLSKILPVFGDKRLQDITHLEIQKFISSLAKKGYSRSYISHILTEIRAVFRSAMQNEVITKNPSTDIILPKEKKIEHKTLQQKDIPIFLDSADLHDPDTADIFEFFLLTGLRLGEFLGLTEDRYDSEKKTILVDRQLDSKNSSMIFRPTKTENSRTIRLSKRACEILEKRLEQNKKHREEDPTYNPFNIVFWQTTNKPYSSSKLREHLKTACEFAGIEKLKIHELRHTYASILIQNGVDVKTVQYNLGHSSIDMTLNIYAHESEESKEQASNKLDDLWSSL